MERDIARKFWTAALTLATLVGIIGAEAQGPKSPEPVGWGRAQDGLQVGLLPDMPWHEFRPGDTLAFSLHVRNVGSQAVEYPVKTTDSPLLTLSAGGRLRLQTGTGAAAPLRLAPGQEALAPSGAYQIRLIRPGDQIAPAPIPAANVAGDAGPHELAIALLPGRYTLECPEPLWIADKNDPNSATAHHAHAGVLTFTVAAGPPPTVPVLRAGPTVTAGPPDTQWGEAVDGLQAGLSRDPTPPGAAPRLITFTFVLRNVSDRSLAVSSLSFEADDWSPMVTDAQGHSRPVRQVFFSGFRTLAQRSLLPGEVLTIGHPRLHLHTGKDDTPVKQEPVDLSDAPPPPPGHDVTPTLAAEPGRYVVSLVDSVRFVGLNNFDVVLVTGPVPFDMPAP